MYLHISQELPISADRYRNLPDGAERAAVGDALCNRERLLDFAGRAGRGGLLDEHRDPGEELEDLELDVAPGLHRPAEHGRGADDDRAWHVLARHVLHKVLERAEDAGVLVRGAHERLALLLQHCRRTVDRRIDQRDDLEARSEFAVGRAV